jgi:hypothetical protein
MAKGETMKPILQYILFSTIAGLVCFSLTTNTGLATVENPTDLSIDSIYFQSSGGQQLVIAKIHSGVADTVVHIPAYNIDLWINHVKVGAALMPAEDATGGGHCYANCSSDDCPPDRPLCEQIDGSTDCGCNGAICVDLGSYLINQGAAVTVIVDAENSVSEWDESNNSFSVIYSVPVPTLTEWGLIIFGVVLLGFISWVFLKRRKAASVRV